MEISKEFDEFLLDIENNMTDKAEIEYVKQRLDVLKNAIVPMDSIEKRLSKVEGILKNMQDSTCHEDAFEFEVRCPFCSSEFAVDINGESDDIKCPNCKEIIELDWSEDEEEGCCGGGCCGGGCHTSSYDEDM